MTDITDQDRRDMLEWARIAIASKDNHEHAPWATAARYILATVDAPATTLAEELANITEAWQSWTAAVVTGALTAATTRARKVEHDRDEARAEAERLAAVNENLRRTDNFREFKEFLGVQKGAESNAESIDPADVKPGEPWLIRVRGRDAVAIRDGHEEWPWSVAFIHGESDEAKDDVVTLVSRLVPAPRVITNPDELDRLAECAIVRDKDGDAWRRTCDEWTTTADYVRFTSWAVSRSGPVTVLWEPEA